jgi:1H-pyrrole-2-carbonyl-[peptidyl-carrier protein] chlorinase
MGMSERKLDADVIVIGGGPAGSTLATLLARDGHKVLLLEKDVHPRDHVGESLVPSTNLIFERIGFLDKMDDAGFIHKPGTGWNAPRSNPWQFIDIQLFEFPLPGTPRPYTYSVERDVMDAMLIRHAHEQGAKVLQGVKVKEVLFEDGRAVGVRAVVTDGWERDLYARVVVDASGRRCLLAGQLGLKRKDPNFNQFCMYSWFRGVEVPPEKYTGFTLFYFLGLNKSWAWNIPLRDGVTSMGVVVDKRDFQVSGRSEEEFFYSLVRRNRGFTQVMEKAERIRPWWIEADYSYKIDRYAGPGWMLVGDAVRFVDPVFSSGVDVALFSALYAYEAITQSWRTGDESTPFSAYEHRVGDGIDIWYELIETFYQLQSLVSRFVTNPIHRERIIRTLQGNPYDPDTQARARALLDVMHASFDKVMADPGNLLRPYATFREIQDLAVCPDCLGVVDYVAAEHAFVCRKCGGRREGSRAPASVAPTGGNGEAGAA